MSYELVHKRVIEKEVWSKIKGTPLERDVVWHLCQDGILTVKKMVPKSVYRMHCLCCYGDGPDIEHSEPLEQEDGSAVIEFKVDHDFVIPEDCE